ncbi:methionine synthase [Acidimicrobium ferrooxidans DSM 10331]|uniref:Methionine synthase n=1 Tax=Acidimicrobium ferrooxidans (strain DSM 10331 / JCM 15462 / NBRC 103882 / ICP) TaxID=525909 RepID=C7LY65_ACIFD|nr:methionine synthase [Acidimicrobium ferrooxidans]ACU53673.1 methionine synthase [Acidimicrobium ferrooxidans DSM 10331]
MRTYEELLRERVVVFDGAMGTNLQLAGLGADDFGGPALEGCNEILVVTRPEAVAAVHDSFLAVGVDVVETDTFGALAPVLAEYGIAERAYELNLRAAQLARDVASGYATPDHPRFVAGSMGPGTKLPSLGQIPFEDLRDAYEVQAEGLIAGGVDLLLVETVYDLLSAKAAVIGARRAMRRLGRSVPVQVQVTIETTGRMLPGTEVGAALAALERLDPVAIGINCATGPEEMGEHLRYLSEHQRVPISCLPNAGMPHVVDGHMHYDLTPDALAAAHRRFVDELGVGIVGGCCGTRPEHLRAVVEAVGEAVPRERHPTPRAQVASLYQAVELRQDLAITAVGERTNANGSRRFRDAMLARDWDTCVRMAQDQVRDGAHMIDLCVDYTGEDGTVAMEELSSRLATASTLPIMIDSTEAAVVETALRHLGGRPIINSVNLEEGEGSNTRFDSFLRLAKDYGAAVVATCIDEEGQARTAARKVEIAKRIVALAVERYGLATDDIIIDPLVLPVTTGMEESRRDALETIEALRRITAEMPGVSTLVGLSNVSFGINAAAREALNSVFLAECQAAGLSMAILHPSRIQPLARIPEDVRAICLDLIYDRRGQGDPLARLIERFADVQAVAVTGEELEALSVPERLHRRIVDANRQGLEDDLAAALGEGMSALGVINDVLLPAMAEVGDLFGSGQMQLPFVLASAETMKQAVAWLEPYLDRASVNDRGTVVLATVQGDVHDIGKNLVDIILTNNGYRVVNLGIKVALSEMLAAAEEHHADAIGMSGLLVKSTLVMRDNLVEMNERGMAHLPVILGGAALTRTFVERDLRQVYDGRVFYGKDAFEGLDVLERLGRIRRGELDDPEFGRSIRQSSTRTPRLLRRSTSERTERSPTVAMDNPIFRPPFLGTRVVKGIALDDIAAYVNETALFRHQWGYRPEGDEDDAAFKQRLRAELRRQLDRALVDQSLVPQVVYGYFVAASEGNDLVVFADEAREHELARFRFPRQEQEPYLCIADFFRPLAGPEIDYVAFHVVTMGPRITEVAKRAFDENRYQEYLLLHGLGVELTEALAEYWHARIRAEWGFGDEDGPTLAGLFRQQYRGSRYSWGYPACPDLEDNRTVVDLLDAGRIGVSVSDTFQLEPEQTTTAIIVHHPQAKYFVA